MIIPNIWKNKKCSKPPTSIVLKQPWLFVFLDFTKPPYWIVLGYSNSNGQILHVPCVSHLQLHLDIFMARFPQNQVTYRMDEAENLENPYKFW